MAEEGEWERVVGEDDWDAGAMSWEEEDYPTTSTSDSNTSSDCENEEGNDQGGNGNRHPAVGVGLGTALLLGATLGLGVGISVAAVATIASQQIKEQGPTLLDKLGFNSSSNKFKQRIPLNAEKWCQACDSEGRLRDFDVLLKEVAKGGVCPTIRSIVWPFLLGLVRADSSSDERALELEKLKERYQSLLDFCKSLQRELLEKTKKVEEAAVLEEKDDVGEEDNVEETDKETPNIVQSEEYKENKRILNLDLVRTDFSSMSLSSLDTGLNEDAKALGVYDHIEKADYLSQEQKQYAKYMGKLLLCYSVHDPPTGYCQGMTDLVQPFAEIFQDDAMSFWAFASFMKTARENFMTDESGIMKRISLIKLVISDIAPELFEKINEIGAGSFFFSYRMILVFLRRELSIKDATLFWETIWVEDLFKEKEEKGDVPEFLVFAIVALIIERTQPIMKSCSSESDVVHMFCNLKINVWHMIEEARFIREKWLSITAGGN